MDTVSVRELKENLSRYLKRVKSGERIIVTDRKKEIAILLPRRIEEETESALRIVGLGLADWSGGKPKGMKNRVITKGKQVSEAMIEDRR
jgi:prevent-host-death family protein